VFTSPLAASFAAALLLGGCGSTPPTDWYVLSARTPATVMEERPTVGIVTLQVAEYLLAPQMLSMEGGNRVRRAEFARWAEPLDKGIARVLSLDLAAELGTQGVRVAPWPREWVPDYELRLRIDQLDAREGAVDLVAAWSTQGAAGASARRDRVTRVSRPRSGTDAAAMAADFSALLADLAVAIAAELPPRAGAAPPPGPTEQ
jgi:uncharacterized lipoprotein YmbA